MRYEFQDQLSFANAHALSQAMYAALKAMANYGSDNDAYLVVAELHAVALKAEAAALNAAK